MPRKEVGSHAELLLKLEHEVDARRITPAQMLDTLIQKANFDARRRDLWATHTGKFVGIVEGQVFAEDDLHALLTSTRQLSGQLYFEPVPPAVMRISR